MKFMKKIGLLFSALAFSIAGFAKQPLPTIPDNCFDENLFCAETKVVDVDGERVIRVKFVAMTTISEYPTAQSIIDKYFDFESWFDYTEGTESIKIETSKEMLREENNDRVRHYSHYIVQAPFPIRKARTREITEYNRIENAEGAMVSYRFALVPGPHHNLPESEERYKTLEESEGVKKKEGEIHIQFNEETGEYILYMVTDVIPAIDLLPKVAAPFIERAFVAVARGMLNI